MSIRTEIIVPATTTQRISTFKSKATSAPLASNKWDKSQWTFKAKRIVTVRSKPTKEHSTPAMTLLKDSEARKRSKYGEMATTRIKDGRKMPTVAITPPNKPPNR